MEYFVLKNGRAEGPFSEAEMIGSLAAGTFAPGDLGRTAGARHWVPLHSLFRIEMELDLEVDEKPVPGVSVRIALYRQAASRIVSQVRNVFDRCPLETGVLCLAVACVVVVLSYVPALIFGPWLLAAMAAGGVLMNRGHVLSGLLLAAAAVFLPIALWVLMASLTGRLTGR